MGEATVSAVLPVHVGVDPGHLAEAVSSLLRQTRLPDEVVVVRDGPLRPEHDAVLTGLVQHHPHVVEVSLEANCGAGVANQAGLAAATGEWIAKLDSDDVCLPARIERQLEAVSTRDLDVCGSAMLEFDDDPTRPVAVRRTPLDHAAIAARMRVNNPINHPTSFYRRALALSVGGYADLRYMQDYDLFARMLTAGARMANLAEPLVLFRADDGMRRRRSARSLWALEWELQRRLHRYGLVGTGRMALNLATRLTFRVLPAPLMRLAYRRLLSTPLSASGPGGVAE